MKPMKPGGNDTAPCSFAQVHDHRFAKDSGMSWGRSGAVETTAERNAPAVGNDPSTGIDPVNVTQTSPMPADFGRPVTPAPNAAHGNLNAAGIYEATKID